MTSDEDRSGVMLEALADFARANPVIVLSYHKRIIDLARKHVPAQDSRLCRCDRSASSRSRGLSLPLALDDMDFHPYFSYSIKQNALERYLSRGIRCRVPSAG
jgi:hypothetical protein